MPFSLVPDRVFDRYADITPAYLSERGVTLLLSDLDFTLAAKKTPRPDQPLREWIADLAAHGIGFMIVSNNRSGRRVTEFCADLGVPYQGHARKPSPRGLRAAMERQAADRYAGGQPLRCSGTDGGAGGRPSHRLAEGAPRPAIALQGCLSPPYGENWMKKTVKSRKNTCNSGQHTVKYLR